MDNFKYSHKLIGYKNEFVLTFNSLDYWEIKEVSLCVNNCTHGSSPTTCQNSNSIMFIRSRIAGTMTFRISPGPIEAGLFHT